MHLKFIIITCFALLQIVSSRPRSKLSNEDVDSHLAESKDWAKQKHVIPMIVSGMKSFPSKRNVEEKAKIEELKVNIDKDEKEKPEDTNEESPNVPEDPSSENDSMKRVKKQSPNNVCIKASGCGKTVCGPIVSARGAVVGDMRSMIQGGKAYAPMNGARASTMKDNSAAQSSNPMQARTIDLLNLSPLPVGSVGYGASTLLTGPLSAPSEGSALGYGHSFIKPPSLPSVPTVPALPTIPALMISPHSPPPPIIHPLLIPHMMPHLMSSVAPSFASYLVPHRIETQRLPEVTTTELKQPFSVVPQPVFASSDNTLICQPVRSQRVDTYPDYIYKPDIALDKSLNISESKYSTEEGKIQDHLRKVNEIKDEITQLNRAAQRIVDQQERLTQMQQQQQHWGGSSMSSSLQGASHIHSPYMGSGYYNHPGMPWGYSRSNILSYPNSEDDAEFFMNLLRAGRKFGLLAETVKPVLNAAGEALKGEHEPTKAHSDSIEKTSVKPEESKMKSHAR